jgi:hypothetical protein
MIDAQLNAQIEMGALADQFWKSELGQYVFGRCQQIMERCKAELVTVDPEDHQAIRKLQNEIHRAGAVPGFFNELLDDYRNALDVIESNDSLEEE